MTDADAQLSETLDLSGAFDLGDRAYLDGANHGPLPRRSLAAAHRALDWKRDPTGLDDRLYFDLPNRVRAAGSRLFGCEPEDVAVATGASHGISLVACGLDWRPGDRVVIPAGEFPANALPWLALREQGVTVDVVPPAALLESIVPGTRVVAVGHVNFANGRRLDAAAIGARCAEVEAIYVIDVAQSLGALPVDVCACQVTVAAAAGYKWLMCPYGTGLTYVHPDWVERLRLPFFNWSSIEGADDFNKLVDLAPRFRPGAARFDVPETAAFVHGAAMAESLELLDEVGAVAAALHSWALIDRLVDTLPDGFEVESPLTPEARSTIVRVVTDDRERTRAAWSHLRQGGVAVSLREGGLRIAPGIWNRPEDIDRLVEGLAEARRAR